MTKEWIDHRSDKRKGQKIEVADSSGEVVGEVQTFFDDKATLAGAIMEVRENLEDGYKIQVAPTTLGESRKGFVLGLVRKLIRSAC